MNQFDAVDFSECHSEEVISFFWRSVYKTVLLDYSLLLSFILYELIMQIYAKKKSSDFHYKSLIKALRLLIFGTYVYMYSF